MSNNLSPLAAALKAAWYDAPAYEDRWEAAATAARKHLSAGPPAAPAEPSPAAATMPAALPVSAAVVAPPVVVGAMTPAPEPVAAAEPALLLILSPHHLSPFLEASCCAVSVPTYPCRPPPLRITRAGWGWGWE